MFITISGFKLAYDVTTTCQDDPIGSVNVKGNI